MVYTDQYDDRIVMKYGVELDGWPFPKFRNPSDISSLADLNTLDKALEGGSCKWVQLSNEQYEKRQVVLEKEVEEGSRKSLKWAGRLKSSRKRKRAASDGKRHRKQKRRKSAAEDSDNESEPSEEDNGPQEDSDAGHDSGNEEK
ncbi:MAG TPA: hypothetical protein VGO47_03720 [Chlamydiales bacterium]|jgi:hypothetical protein|nr:hypothetical protein [Chlamydiales bacterium]